MCDLLSLRVDKDPTKSLACKVSTKMEEGDFNGAVHFVSSEEVIAGFLEETFRALQ